MEFKVTKNNLKRKSEIKSLKLCNEEYEVTIFYYGDYEKDMEQGACDRANISLSCKPKKDSFLLSLILGEIMINTPDSWILNLNEIEWYKEMLDMAKEAAIQLQSILKEYFGIVPLETVDKKNIIINKKEK